MQNNPIQTLKSICLLAVPIVGTFLSQKAIQVTNTFMLGHISVTALAAGSLFMSFYMLLIVINMGLFNAVNIVISRKSGANESVQKHFAQGVYIAIFASVPFILCTWFLPIILRFMPKYAEIADTTLQLSRAASFGIPGTLFYLLLRETITAFKRPKINWYVVLAAIPLFAFVNYYIVFIHQSGNKIVLIGYSNAFIEWFLAIGLLACIYFSDFLRTNLFSDKHFKLSFSHLFDILKIGLPNAAILALDVGMVMAAGFLAGYFGASSLSAYQIALQLTTIAYMFPIGIGFALTTLISHQYGARHFSEIRKIFKTGICLSMSLASCLLLVFLFFGKPLSLLFLSDLTHINEVISYSIRFLMLAGFLQLLDSGLAIMNSTLRAIGDVIVPLYCAILCYWLLGIGSILLLCFVFKIGAIGIWVGLCIGIGSAFLLLAFRVRYQLEQITLI